MKTFIRFLKTKHISDKDINLVKERFPMRFSSALKFQNKEDFLQSVGVGILLLKQFPNSNENDYKKSSNGKLYLPDNLFFSISHKNGLVGIAFSNQQIGFDIERIEKKNLHYSSKIFSKSQLDWVKNKKKRFSILWTKMESSYKLLDEGINSFSNQLIEDKRIIFKTKRKGRFIYSIATLI